MFAIAALVGSFERATVMIAETRVSMLYNEVTFGRRELAKIDKVELSRSRATKGGSLRLGLGECVLAVVCSGIVIRIDGWYLVACHEGDETDA